MARHKIVWSHRAKIRLFEILDYFAERNSSKTYSEKPYHKFNKGLKLLILMLALDQGKKRYDNELF